MSVIKVRKRFDLCGSSECDLKQRIEVFGDAIRARKGAILKVRWLASVGRALHSARVLYELPLVVRANAFASSDSPQDIQSGFALQERNVAR